MPRSVGADLSTADARRARRKGRRPHRLKELRPGSVGTTEIRILFAFDPQRRAIVLVAGDKAGNWRKWYQQNIQIADDRFDDHIARLKGKS